MRHPLVKMINIHKWFGHVHALKGVDFHVNRKEIVGLVGDNGAGKSTLVKILVGAYKPDKGEIYFEGKKVNFKSPREARNMGIEIVYQDLALIDLLSISRNFFLGREPLKKLGPFNFLDHDTMRKESIKILKNLGLTRIQSPDQRVATLSGGEKQSVAIGRALYFNAKLIILDEPTASLSVKETRKVLDHVLEAKDQGASVIFITHNIYHVYEVADRFVILDHGRKIADVLKDKVDPEDIIEIIRSGGKAIRKF